MPSDAERARAIVLQSLYKDMHDGRVGLLICAVKNALATVRAEQAAEIERLNNQIAEWSRANLAIVAKCSSVERANAEQAERHTATERDACQWTERCERAERERDEARTEAKDWRAFRQWTADKWKEDWAKFANTYDELKGRANTAEARLAQAQERTVELERECGRLREVATKEPHHAYLEAVQRACDERLGEQKHALRAAEARLTQARAEIARIRAEGDLLEIAAADAIERALVGDTGTGGDHDGR